MTTAPVPSGRLAPSPTGWLHLGHARSFLLAYWSIRSRGGHLHLRMEDLDAARVRPDFITDVLADLEWLGLDWDGPVVYQSERTELYQAAIDRLDAAGALYPCVCSRKEIAQAVAAPHDSDAETRYPGTCRGRFESLAQATAASDRPPCLRLRVPHGQLHWNDLLSGPQHDDVAATAGDFPVTTRAGYAAYQLAVVVDDAEQGITEVLRGDDLRASTARQALLQSALGLEHPTWFHVPLVVDHTGRRLAKRDDDFALRDLRLAGADPRALVAWAARTSGMPAPERITASAAANLFELPAIPHQPATLTESVLASLRAART